MSERSATIETSETRTLPSSKDTIVGSKSDGKRKFNEGDHTQLVASHYNNLQEMGLRVRTQSRIFYLRNFNNWIKSVLIGETLGLLRKFDGHRRITALDLCCGKGGDLLKWKKGNIDYLVCVDIASASVEQCKTRYTDIKKRRDRSESVKQYCAEFIVADCTQTQLKSVYRDPGILFDIVSCQFSFHYCFESYAQAVTMIRNAAECLQPGGYFIGTTTNAYELVHRLRDSTGTSLGSDVFSVKYEGDMHHIPLFGAKYKFSLEGVVDCPEFLVYFPLFEKMCMKFGLRLIVRQRFDDFFQAKVKLNEHRILLEKMMGLESYPADVNKQLVGNSLVDYVHATNFLDAWKLSAPDNKYASKIGTLSKAEWEAATLYLVFVFQKDIH